VAGGATVGPGRDYRLDPHTLPARGSAVRGGAVAATFIVEQDRAVVTRGDRAHAVPLAAYRGVAVRMESAGDDGSVVAFVELLHDDPELTLPLAVTHDAHAVAGDWQEWAQTLQLPLLVIGQDGSVGEPLAAHRGLIMARPRPRRRHSYFAKRRPRFLTRRKVGHLDAVRVVFGREIIARD
jgi:hypothetical protein